MSKPWTNTNFICARIVLGLFICTLSSHPQATANHPCGYENGTHTWEYKLLKIPQNASNNAISRNKIQKCPGEGHKPNGEGDTLPTPIRTYGALILGFLAPTQLDTRHPLSKILDPPLFAVQVL